MVTTSLGKTVLVIQARQTSVRLPGKVLRPIAGVPLLSRVIERGRAINGVDGICVAVPEGPGQEELVAHVQTLDNVDLVTGPEDDVLQRTLTAADACAATNIVRITSDCPMFDPVVSGAVIAAFHAAAVGYARTSMHDGYPLGFDTEVISTAYLRKVAGRDPDAYEREHVTPFIWRRPDEFSTVILTTKPDRRRWRLVVDAEPDLEFANVVYSRLYAANQLFGLAELVDLFIAEPEILSMNAEVDQTPYLDSAGDAF